MITKPLPPAVSAVRRPVCPSCCRPERACICCWAKPTTTEVEVVILQHPLEASHPKGSARLLHLSLPGSRLVIGESFSEEMLHDLLYQPLGKQPQPGEVPLRQPVLLYPATSDMPAPAMQNPDSLPPASIRLIVLDGTWRKSRRMLGAHPLLQTLPRFALAEPPVSRYRIRQAYRPDQLSTLEAVCHTLAQLENDELKYQPLLATFDGFIDVQQIWFSRNSRKRPALPD
jgi:DTW domain-containing protein YfiP